MLELNNIHKRYKGFELNVSSLKIQSRSHFILLGPTGSGKTLLMNIIAGIVSPDCGRLMHNSVDITSKPPEKRGFGIVYQDSALFPHMSVEENIAFALQVRKVNRGERGNRTIEMMSRTGIEYLFGRSIEGLSGGEKQRVALARALIIEPEILLLDEPFNSLDYATKESMIALIKQIRSRINPTIIHITHDFEEALMLADCVGVIKYGSIAQCGNVIDVFRSPDDLFVANFVGARNIFAGNVVGEGDDTRFSTVEGKIFFVGRDINGNAKNAMIRAEDIIISRTYHKSSATNNFRGKVVDIIKKRGINEIVVDFGVKIHSYITNRSLIELDIKTGEDVYIIFKGSAIHLF